MFSCKKILDFVDVQHPPLNVKLTVPLQEKALNCILRLLANA